MRTPVLQGPKKQNGPSGPIERLEISKNGMRDQELIARLKITARAPSE